MTALDQLLKLAGNLPLDKLAQFLPLDRLPLDKLAGNAIGKLDELKHRERMSSVDTAWLRMDTPTNLMMIVGVMMFEGAPPPDAGTPQAAEPHAPTISEASSPESAPTKASRPVPRAKKEKSAPRAMRLQDLAATEAGADAPSAPVTEPATPTPVRMKKKGLLARARG